VKSGVLVQILEDLYDMGCNGFVLDTNL